MIACTVGRLNSKERSFRFVISLPVLSKDPDAIRRIVQRLRDRQRQLISERLNRHFEDTKKDGSENVKILPQDDFIVCPRFLCAHIALLISCT